ncbi:hypothetical protein ACQ4PT_023883 [Festuca glaucescens]
MRRAAVPCSGSTSCPAPGSSCSPDSCRASPSASCPSASSTSRSSPRPGHRRTAATPPGSCPSSRTSTCCSARSSSATPSPWRRCRFSWTLSCPPSGQSSSPSRSSLPSIMPQAICTRYGLSMGAKAAPIVRVLLVLFFPVAYPISKLLDWLLGKGHVALMRRAELKTLVDMHGNEAGKGGELTHDETTIITGALEMTQKTAKDAMTPISETFSLDINAKLDLHTVGMIMSKGHSRIPIYSGRPSNIIGLILVKNLLTCRPEDEVPTRHVTIRKIPRVADDLPLYDILNEFQKGHSHMAVVVKRTKEAGASAEKNNGVPSDYKINHVHADDLSPSDLNMHGSRRNNTEKYGDGRPYSKKIERKRNNILDFNTDPLPCYSMDEEAVGIITMEDVMEELLQIYWMKQMSMLMYITRSK